MSTVSKNIYELIIIAEIKEELKSFNNLYITKI